MKARQDSGIECLMRSHCRSKSSFLFGFALGITLGCTITLTYVLQLEQTNVPSAAVSRKRLELVGNTEVHRKSAAALQEQAIYEQDFNPSRNLNPKQMDSSEKGEEETGNVHREDFFVSSIKKQKKLFNIDRITDQLSVQYSFRKPYLVSIITSQPSKGNTEAIYDTWARDVTNIKFFTSPTDIASQLKVEGMPVIELPFLTNENPGNQAFKVLEYLYRHHFEDYDWFVLAPDNVYMNPHGLEEFLSRLDPNANTYIGHPAKAGHTFCLGSPGVILSRTAVANLIPKLNWCSANTGRNWDEQLGHCFDVQFDIQCAREASEAQIYFVYDEYERSRSIKMLSEDSIFTTALTIAPVVSEDHMYLLHFHYKVRHTMIVADKLSKLLESIDTICLKMPKDLLENTKVINWCSNLHPELVNGEDISITNQQEPIHTLSSKFHPLNRFQAQPWSYFDAFNIYEGMSIHPSRNLKTYRYNFIEIQKALQEAVKAASRQHHSKLRFKKILNGYVRHNALLGNEYIIDARFVEARNPKKKVEKRIRLLRPLTSSFLIQSAKNNISETVNFVVPLTKVTNRLNEFLKMYEKLFLSTHEKTRLVLSVYGEDDVQQIKKNITQYQRMYGHAKITIAQGYGEFSRSKALDLGMSTLNDNDLAFLCDVDMDIDREFLTKCRRNTEQGQTVYYPEVFKLYNRKYVYRNGWKSTRFSISRQQGHWGYYAFGMLCIYKSDYNVVGGLDKGMIGWGGEDVDFYERVLHSSLTVLRVPDTSLIHRWHEKECKMERTSKMYEHCLLSKAEALADKRELARYIFDIDKT